MLKVNGVMFLDIEIMSFNQILINQIINLTKFTNLEQIGWNKFFEDQMTGLEENLIPGRVIISNKNNYLISIGEREITGEVSGKFHFNAESKDEFPAVGDWVLMRKFDDYDNAIIESVMKRKSKLSRNSAGQKLEEQILASNIDIVFIISSLNQDINLRRLERYVSLIIDNKLTPVMILSKAVRTTRKMMTMERIKMMTAIMEKVKSNYI